MSNTQQCFSCGYDLSSIEDQTARCPECGQNRHPPYRTDILAESNRRRAADRKMLLCMCIFLSPIIVAAIYAIILMLI